MTAGRKREAVRRLEPLCPQASERRRCRLLGLSRSSLRYASNKAERDGPLSKRLQELARKHPRYGYRRMSALLRQEGWRINDKRVYRVWRESGLKVPKR